MNGLRHKYFSVEVMFLSQSIGRQCYLKRKLKTTGTEIFLILCTYKKKTGLAGLV